MKGKPILAIDYDHTVMVSFPENYGKLKEDVVETINKLWEEFEIVIYSCRSSLKTVMENPKAERQMIGHLKLIGVKFDKIHTFKDGGKPNAFAFIDDRNIAFRDNWKEIGESLLKGELL